MEEQNYNTPTSTDSTNMNAPQEQVPQTPEPEPSKGGGMGALIGIVIIVLLLILGGLYFWGAQLDKQLTDESELFMDDANSDISNDSDEPEAIEEDLNEFNSAEFDAQLEADLKSLEGEF